MRRLGSPVWVTTRGVAKTIFAPPGIAAALDTYLYMNAVSLPASSCAQSVTPAAAAIDDWAPARSDTLLALQARDRYLAKHAEACSLERGDAAIVALFAPEQFRPALGNGTEIATAAVHRPSMHAVIAKQYCLFGCSLIYLPMLPGTIGAATLSTLLDCLVSWLRPGGEIILSAFTVLPEPPSLRAAADWCPLVMSPERLLLLARDIDDAGARVQREHADKLAFLHLQRH